jgi:hypothetical protein
MGNKTVVRLDDGTVLWYCHESDFGVEVGERLAPGGGEPVDPECWLPGHGCSPEPEGVGDSDPLQMAPAASGAAFKPVLVR